MAACRRCEKPLRADEHPYCDGCLAYYQDRAVLRRKPAPRKDHTS
jgi:hypothetical protein